jgi:hypothetical protein
MKFIFVFALLFITQIAYAQYDNLVEVLNTEIYEVKRLNQQVKSRNPNLLLRLAELHLERARVYKEIENAKFMQQDQATRKKIDRKKFFSKSNSDFYSAQKICYFIVKNYKKYKGIGDVYYILAFNAKEFNEIAKAKKYFQFAIKQTAAGSTTNNKAKLALAEIYYNDREYGKASALYQQALADRSNKWWTKDAYNYAWALFRTGKKSEAINLMKQVSELSKTGKYHDLSEDVSRDLAYFYTEAGNVNAAVSFYKESNRPLIPNLIKMSKILLDQGKMSEARKVLFQAKGLSPTPEQDVEINHSLLLVFEKYAPQEDLKTVSRSQADHHKNGLLQEFQKDQLVTVLQTHARTLQQQISSRRYHSRNSILAEKVSMGTYLYLILAEIEPKKKAEFTFFAAETYLAGDKFGQALETYSQSLEIANQENNQEIRKKSLEGMKFVVGKPGINKEMTEKYLIPMYLITLKEGADDKDAHKIYQRLFTEYMNRGDTESAKKTLDGFSKRFQNDSKTQEAMIGQMTDYFRKKGDKDNLGKMLTEVSQKKYNVSPLFLSKSNSLLTNTSFERAQQFQESGNKVNALREFYLVYKSPDSSAETKAKAAYSITVAFYEASKVKPMLKWLKATVSLLKNQEIESYLDSIMLMLKSAFLRKNYSESLEIGNQLFEKICSSNHKAKPLLANYLINLNLLIGNLGAAVATIDKMEKCNLPDKAVAAGWSEIINDVENTDNVELLVKISSRAAAKGASYSEIAYVNTRIVNAMVKSQKISEAKKHMATAKRYYELAKQQKEKMPLELLDEIGKYEVYSLKSEISNLKKIKFSFPEQKFKSALDRKLAELSRILTKVKDIELIGSGRATVLAYRILFEAYDDVVSEIENFRPVGLTPEQDTEFSKIMTGISGPIKNQRESHRLSIQGLIKNKEILSSSNSFFTVADPVAIPNIVNLASPMQKTGQL